MSTATHLPISLFQDNPAISVSEWMNATGLKTRAYYNYRKRAYGAHQIEDNQGDESQPRAIVKTNRRTAAKIQAAQQEASKRNDILGTSLVRTEGQRRAILIVLFLSPTLASVTNMYSVLTEISDNWFSAGVLTVVFALTALGFAIAGIRSRVTRSLIVGLVAFEAFCNMVRIYGGLYNYVDGSSTHFLGEVQSLIWFLSSKHTATILSLFAAGTIAAVQYNSLNEINKKNAHTHA